MKEPFHKRLAVLSMPWYAHKVTSKVTLPQVEEAARRVREQLKTVQQVAIVGDPASGRSTVLGELACELRSAARIATPRTGDDAAAVSLMDLASQLPNAKELTSELKRLDLRWTNKLECVGGALEMATDLVVLFDEPVLVPRSGAPQDAFERRRIEFAEMVMARAGKVVFTAEPSAVLLQPNHVTIHTKSDSKNLLAPGRWGEWAAFAAQLAEAGGARLDDWSPLALRMAVALVAQGAEHAPLLVEQRPGARSLAFRLVALLERDPALRAIAETLALVRLPFTPDLLDRLGVPALTSDSRRLVTSVLTYEVDGRLVFHDVFARTLGRVASDLSATERSLRAVAHQRLAAYYSDQFESAGRAANLSLSLRFEMEAVHHLTEACDPQALEKFTPFFVEQWDALGKALGQARKYDEAVRCYEKALSHDPEDAYAHHYKAFNLDWRADRVDEVELHYREAIRLERSHVWHHGRFDCFLVTRGRILDARQAWTEAVSDLAPGGDYRFAGIYEELHKPVARLLLHRGELDFAREVLADVTDPVARGADWFRSLSRYLQVLDEAARDEVVFPPHVSPEERWNGPHTVPGGSRPDGLSSWTPGRVARVDGREVHVRVAVLEGGAPRFGWRSFDAAKFRKLSNWAWDVPAGTFIEILQLVGDKELIRTHESLPLEPRLPGITPPPDRYLRRVASPT